MTGLLVLLACAGCGPWALYLRSPSGRYFEPAVTRESMPQWSGDMRLVGDSPQPGAQWGGSAWAPAGADPSLFEGLLVTPEAVTCGDIRVELGLSEDIMEEHMTAALARRNAQTMVVDVLARKVRPPIRYYGDIYHHRIAIDIPSGRTEYRKERLARAFCFPEVRAHFRPDGRLEIAMRQHAIRGFFLIPIPLGTIEKTNLLVEKELPFANESTL